MKFSHCLVMLEINYDECDRSSYETLIRDGMFARFRNVCNTCSNAD